jgi:hypothetical protein
MRARSECTPAGGGAPAGTGVWVSIVVGDAHPLRRLQQALAWVAITAGMVLQWRRAGKNVDGGPGLPWPVARYVPVLVLLWLKSYHSRQMEEYLRESVVARRLLALQEAEWQPLRDPSSIARAEAALGAEGKAAVNAVVIKTAQPLPCTDGQTRSSDTTVQEPAMGYPNEPGSLKGRAERSARALTKLRAGGVQGAKAGSAQAPEVYRSVNPPQLLAKTKAEKQQLLAATVTQSEARSARTQAVLRQVSARCGRVKQRAAATLSRRGAVAHPLLPQLKQWLKTGKGATEKISHAGLTAARALTKGKGKGKFGLKGLSNRVTGGSLFGQRGAPRADETQMPAEAVQEYRKVVGEKATPKLGVYDRGARLPAAAAQRTKAGVRKVGLPPRGQGAWLVGEQEQKVVKSEGGKTAGSLGRLQSRKYGFSPRQERSVETQDAAGQRASGSANLTTLMRDLVAQAKPAR